LSAKEGKENPGDQGKESLIQSNGRRGWGRDGKDKTSGQQEKKEMETQSEVGKNCGLDCWGTFSGRKIHGRRES